MWGLTTLIWVLVGTTLAGIGITVIVTNPYLLDNGRTMIPLICGGAYVVAVPFSYIIARKLKAGEHART